MVRTKKYRIKSNIRKKTLKQKKIKTRNRKSINKKKKSKRKTQKGGATETINKLQELFNKISVSSKKWNPHNKTKCHDALIELANLDNTNRKQGLFPRPSFGLCFVRLVHSHYDSKKQSR